jgi:aryl-alcohol dehydrogenase-like predicted oxidoreductase
VQAFVDLAAQLKITPAQLALAWCDQLDGVTSTIIGATSMTQLKDNIDAFDIELSEDAHKGIEQVLQDYPSPF